MSSQVPTSDISFSDLRTKWSNKSFGFRTDPGTTNISLGAFRKATLVRTVIFFSHFFHQFVDMTYSQDI